MTNKPCDSTWQTHKEINTIHIIIVNSNDANRNTNNEHDNSNEDASNDSHSSNDNRWATGATLLEDSQEAV